MEAPRIGKTLRKAISSLPEPDDDLEVLVEFCRENNPSQEFKERWGTEYHNRAHDLLRAWIHAFKTDRPTGLSPDELLLCMARHVMFAPYIGISDETALSYLHAMLRELREKL